MNRKNISERFDFARRVDDSICEVKVQSFKPSEHASTPMDSILSVIYSPDPVSGLPVGDIGFYVSDKANPEIKQFILSQLLVDTSQAANPVAPKGLSDSDILLLSRQSGESNDQYMARLNGEVDNFKRISDELQKLSVPKDPIQKSPSE